MAQFDIKKLSRGEQLICLGGIVLLIFSFFNWYDFDGIPESGFSGWDTTLGWMAVVLGIVMVAQILAAKFGDVKMPNLGSVTWGQVHLVLGGLVLLFLIIRLIDTPGFLGVDADRKFGLFISFVGAAVLAGGAFLKFKEEQAGGARPPAN